MDDAAVVRGLDRGRHLTADVERLGNAERPRARRWARLSPWMNSRTR